MRGFKKTVRDTISDNAIEELMLAKTALEEKNALLEEDRRQIRDLIRKNRTIERAQNMLKNTLTEAQNRVQTARTEALKEGMESVIRDLVQMLFKYEKLTDSRSVPVHDLLEMLKKKYGLAVIGEPVEAVDPELHEVIEVVQGHDVEPKIILVEKGFRIGKNVLKPAIVKVIKGSKTVQQSDADEISGHTTVEGIHFISAEGAA